MDIKKLNPWNWFKKEDNESSLVPVERAEKTYTDPLAHLHRE